MRSTVHETRNFLATTRSRFSKKWEKGDGEKEKKVTDKERRRGARSHKNLEEKETKRARNEREKQK